MSEHLDYLKWFLIFTWVPTAIIWVFYWKLLRKYTRVLLFCMGGAILLAWPWDYWATHSWLWHFSIEHTLNNKILGLPLEEYIFFTSETLLYASLAIVINNAWHKRVKG